MMLGYSTVGSNDIERALAFYDEVMAVIGVAKAHDLPRGRLYGQRGAMFGVVKPFDGEAACVGNGAMTGFGLDSREQVDAFHAKVLELGGANEGDPGERAPGAYFAYMRDLDGNKLCAYRFG
jgi:catechol 2,3-dioxygenase-like lactoylglutathione lyase family enzyme